MKNNRVSVRQLVEYCLRSGSIDFEYASRAARALEGAQYHRRLQKKRSRVAALEGFSYSSEVSFSRRFNACGLEITVSGRADGVLIKDGRVYIEEIKTTELPLDKIIEAEQHIAQAKCYAYFYLLEHGHESGLHSVSVLLTYFNTIAQDTKEFEYEFGKNELETFFTEMLNTYAEWASFIIGCKEERDESIRGLSFPYDGYRTFQREMCSAVYRAIERRRPVFISAATGIGKTVSALFPAAKALEKERLDKIFYLTAKTITRTTALEAVRLMESGGFRAKSLVITAKDKVCVLEKAECSPESCTRAAGHFDRVNAALRDILENETVITKDVLLGYSQKHNVCPYEFSLDIALFSDIIVCDYNYAFDPRVYLRRFFAETGEEYVFLIDEAHNLVDRAREMYSASLSCAVLNSLSRRLRKKSAAKLKRLLKELSSEITETAAGITQDDYGLATDTPPKSVVSNAREFCLLADEWLAENRRAKPEYYNDLLDLYFNMNFFVSVSELFDEKYKCCFEREYKDIKLTLFCTDPSGRMEEMLKNAASSVFFSATLTPLDYFKRLLGAQESDYAMTFPSPFPEDNLMVLAVAGISAKYKDRALYYEDIADYIHTAASVKPGNYFAFFPSYAYMESVYGLFCAKYPQTDTLCQTKDMGESEKEEFLRQFTEQESRVFIVFAVLGGMFSEGIDLPGKRLIGAFIISVGLPKLSFERQIISAYFAGSEGRGFEYSYMFPGMNKVLQAGGRVIRTEEDKGIIILIDGRFTHKEYVSLFPQSWSGFQTVRGRRELEAALTRFWFGVSSK